VPAARRAALESIEVGLLLEGVRACYGFDLASRDRVPLLRRLRVLLRAEGLRSWTGLLERVLHRPACFERLLAAVCVQGQAWFDPPALFLALRGWIAERPAAGLRVWHVGCGRGEEVYSLAVTLMEEGAGGRARVYATDLHESVLREASRGRFPLGRLRAMEAAYRAAGGRRELAAHYRVEGQRGTFQPELERPVVFAVHDLASDSSFHEFDLVLCRNVLRHLAPELRDRAQAVLDASLAPGGLLALDRTAQPPTPGYLEAGVPGLFRRTR
jgi:chemotaxis protein methyltransferase CheR